MEQFGKWTVTEARMERGRRRADVTCECGMYDTVLYSNLKAGRSTMCLDCSYVERGAKALGKRRVNGDLLAARDCYSDRRGKATKKGRVFDLTFMDFYQLSKSNCTYCGGEPANVNKINSKEWADDFVYNGLDRLDASMGYSLDNVVPCCWKCNYMKRENSVEDFIAHIKKVLEHVGET